MFGINLFYKKKKRKKRMNDTTLEIQKQNMKKNKRKRL